MDIKLRKKTGCRYVFEELLVKAMMRREIGPLQQSVICLLSQILLEDSSTRFLSAANGSWAVMAELSSYVKDRMETSQEICNICYLSLTETIC